MATARNTAVLLRSIGQAPVKKSPRGGCGGQRGFQPTAATALVL